MQVKVGYHCLEGWPNPLQTIEVLLVGHDGMSQKYLLFEEVKPLPLSVFSFLSFLFKAILKKGLHT